MTLHERHDRSAFAAAARCRRVNLAGPGPDAGELETLLRIASRVPDHGKLAPWRFLVFEGAARDRAGRLALEIKLADDPALDEPRPRRS